MAIAYDPSNGNRALRILEKAGLIEIDKNVKVATVNDITKNPKNFAVCRARRRSDPKDA